MYNIAIQQFCTFLSGHHDMCILDPPHLFPLPPPTTTTTSPFLGPCSKGCSSFQTPSASFSVLVCFHQRPNMINNSLSLNQRESGSNKPVFYSKHPFTIKINDPTQQNPQMFSMQQFACSYSFSSVWILKCFTYIENSKSVYNYQLHCPTEISYLLFSNWLRLQFSEMKDKYIMWNTFPIHHFLIPLWS